MESERLSHGCVHHEWRSVIRLGKTSRWVWVLQWGPKLGSRDLVSATRGEFLCLFSRWLGLHPCWRSCRWWVRRCRPGSRGLRCRRSGVCGSSAHTPPRLPPGTCDWPSARHSRHCEMTGRGRAVTETEVFIPNLLYILWMKHLFFLIQLDSVINILSVKLPNWQKVSDIHQNFDWIPQNGK